MVSKDGALIRGCSGSGSAAKECSDLTGKAVAKADVRGSGLGNTRHPVHIFYVGVGSDADMEVGRLLAEATADAYMRAGEKDLAAILEQFGKYF